jgi:putative tricarboxylic transport membrane protein
MSDEEGRRATPRRPDRPALAIAAGLAALAGLIAWDAAHLRAGAGYARIGPTAFPYVIAACLLGLAAATAVAAWRGIFPQRGADEVAPLVWIIGGLALQLATLRILGFSIATGIMFACAARGFGQRPLLLNVAVGIPLAFAIYIVFAKLLKLTLPTGPLERLFF